jgi:hypothetical protein
MAFRKMVLIPQNKYNKLISREERQEDTSDSYEALDKHIILKAVQKNFRSRAESLLEHLESDNNITWNNKGAFIYKGHIVPQSNISDLIRYCMREYTSFKPVGLDIYIKALAAANAPESLIVKSLTYDDTSTDNQSQASQPSPGTSRPPPGVREETKQKWIRY